MEPWFDTDAPEPEQLLAEFFGKTIKAIYVDETVPDSPEIVVSAEGGLMLHIPVDEDGDLVFVVEQVY